MEIKILAQEPRILVGGRPVEMGPPKERLLLAVLAHSAGKVVSVQALIHRVWGQDTPASIRTSLYSHITRIRNRVRDLGAVLPLVSRAPGYVLDVDPDSVDLNRVNRLYKEAGKRIGAGERRLAVNLLAQALELWDGDPLSEVRGEWAACARKEMEQTRVRVLVRWAEAQAGLGEYEAVLDRLADACAKHPGNDSLAYHRMRALAATDRQTEAVECYNELRDYHRRENGADPNERTQKLFHEILEEERRAHVRPVSPPGVLPRPPHPLREALPASPFPEAVSRPAPVVWDNLELGALDFVTRESELAGLLARVRSGRGSTVVEVVEGTPGVGKSSFVLHAAHLLRDEFDIRVHLRLHGDGRPVDPTHLLYRLLSGIGVPKEEIPLEPDARAELWRVRAARHRVLLLVDDAVPGQVGPLLPSTPGSAVLVTSRTTLTDLDGAHRLVLGRLDAADSARMFEAFTGMPPDGEAGRRLLSLLGGLPLGLRLVAGRLRNHRTWTLDHLADRIVRNGISEVAVGDRNLASVFDLAYSDLDASARSAFLATGLHPTGEVSLHTLAAMSGSWARAESAVEDLLGNHLVEETSPGTHRMHSLLHDYARRRAAVLLHPAESRGIRRRYLDHTLAVADAADRAALPGRRRWESAPLCEYVPEFPNARAARAWFATGLSALEESVSYAQDHGFTGHVARIPLAAAGLMDTDGPSDRAEALHARSVAAWRLIGSGPGLAQALYELGRARGRLHDPSAEEDVRAALEVWERCGAEGRYGRSLSLDQLGVILHKAGDTEGALEAYHRALAGFAALGEQEGMARALNHIGVSQNRLGRYEAAEDALTRAMTLYKALGDLRSEAQVLVNAAMIHFHRGRHREVRRMCERGLEAFLSLGDVRSVAQTLNNLGQLAEYLQRYDEGLARFREAKELLARVGDTAEELNTDAGIGSTLLGLGRVAEAHEVVTAGLERIRVLRDPLVEAHLLVVLGDVHVARRRYAEARLQYRNARELAGGGVSRLDEGLAWDRLGDLYSREGCTSKADEHWEQAVLILDTVPTPHCASIRMKLEISGLMGA